jgi:hypothetical protein
MKFSLKIGDLVACRRYGSHPNVPDAMSAGMTEKEYIDEMRRVEIDPSGRGCVIAFSLVGGKELVRVRWLHGQEYWMVADESVMVKLTEEAQRSGPALLEEARG